MIFSRGASAQVILEPTQVLADAVTALEYVPTGGRTPLAAALNQAKSYLTRSTLLVLLSDGRANIAIDGGDPWQEALAVARDMECSAVVVDTESENRGWADVRSLQRRLARAVSRLKNSRKWNIFRSIESAKDRESNLQQAQGNSIVLILGGVHSGKSRYAQQLAEQSARVKFVATAERSEHNEMHRNLNVHRAERPSDWMTVEEPLAPASVSRSSEEKHDAILIDCAALLGANLMRYSRNDIQLQADMEELSTTLRDSSPKVILVSNEVGSGVVAAYEMGRRFRDVVGETNQLVAAVSATVILTVAGLPLPLEGEHS